MFQALLADPIHLKFHRETSIASVYACLVAAPNGPKMKESVPFDPDAYDGRGHMSGSGENKRSYPGLFAAHPAH